MFFCLFLTAQFVLFLLNFLNSQQTLDINPLSVTCFADIFSNILQFVEYFLCSMEASQHLRIPFVCFCFKKFSKQVEQVKPPLALSASCMVYQFQFCLLYFQCNFILIHMGRLWMIAQMVAPLPPRVEIQVEYRILACQSDLPCYEYQGEDW